MYALSTGDNLSREGRVRVLLLDSPRIRANMVLQHLILHMMCATELNMCVLEMTGRR